METEKLKILMEGGIITEEIYQKSIQVVTWIYKHYSELNSDAVEGFIVHLCMAVHRMQDGEPLMSQPESGIIEELEELEIFKEIEYIMDHLEMFFGIEFLISERGYCMVHIANVLMKSEERI